MLTKDLIRYKNSKGNISPTFVNPENPNLLKLAGQLVELFKTSTGSSREAVLQRSAAIRENSTVGNLVARGFEKLLMDRLEFDSEAGTELPQFREEILRAGSQLLSSHSDLNLESYTTHLSTQLNLPITIIRQQLYGDLPSQQTVKRIKSITPDKLLQRYNCAQVQGLLIHSSKLEITLPQSRTGSLRQLFKYLRFQQLLASISKTDSGYKIHIDGPLNLFYQTKKYGLSLAMFFPAVLAQPAWKLEAHIQIGRRKSSRLSIDHTSGLKPYVSRFLDYIPKEIGLLQTAFDTIKSDWKIRAAEDFFPLPGDRYCFPDYEFIHSSGEFYALELFHAWHSTQLIDRLHNLEQAGEFNLLIGVATKLAKDKQLAPQLEESSYFQQNGFTFREIPSAKKLNKLLKKNVKIPE
ncbi:MAG: DUF790 family protein [Calditrichia bacterium]